jgi:hypothetical protein
MSKYSLTKWIVAIGLAISGAACDASTGSSPSSSAAAGANGMGGRTTSTGAGAKVGTGSGSAGAEALPTGGNTAGTGNATGAGDFAGTGSAGVNGTLSTCIAGATMPPVAKLITDFSDPVADTASPGQFKFGGGIATEVQGGTAEFADTTETTPTLAIVKGALSVTATSKGSYTGVVLYLNGPACVDGSAYTGVEFDLSGSLGTCNLTFGFAFADDLTAASDSNRGICAATNCYPPTVAVTETGTIKEPYTAVTGGSPLMSVDQQKLTGVQWQIQSPATGTTCTATFTLDNVSFY